MNVAFLGNGELFIGLQGHVRMRKYEDVKVNLPSVPLS